MSKDASFDIVSDFDAQELVNALDQVRRELNTRFDLKDSASVLDNDGNTSITITTTDELRMQNIVAILEEKLIKRGLAASILDPQTIEDSLGGKVRQQFKLKRGIDKETAKKITTDIKASKLKVQAAIQGDAVRVSGKNRDDLQAVIALIKTRAAEWQIPLQFDNYR